MQNWRELIGETLAENGESWGEVIACTLSPAELDAAFYAGYGAMQGEPFTVWTKDFVYFPVCYDGAEWCGVDAPQSERQTY